MTPPLSNDEPGGFSYWLIVVLTYSLGLLLTAPVWAPIVVEIAWAVRGDPRAGTASEHVFDGTGLVGR